MIPLNFSYLKESVIRSDCNSGIRISKVESSVSFKKIPAFTPGRPSPLQKAIQKVISLLPSIHCLAIKHYCNSLLHPINCACFHYHKEWRRNILRLARISKTFLRNLNTRPSPNQTF